MINSNNAVGDGNRHVTARYIESFLAIVVASIDNHLAALEIERSGAPAAARDTDVGTFGDFNHRAAGQTRDSVRTFGGTEFVGVF